jgi:ribosomal protein S18 acetylase RimI-like enzyme
MVKMKRQQNLARKTKMIQIKVLEVSDYTAATQLWQSGKGVVLRSGDSKEGFLRFLVRNPDLSLGAFIENELVGALMIGHDGRRGYLYHLAVTLRMRRSGIGRQLVETVQRNLRNRGIDRLHLFVDENNQEAKKFWAALGWYERSDLVTFSVLTQVNIRLKSAHE